ALAEPTGIGGNYASYKRMSYFGDLNYVYDDRYIFSVTARYDGDSRFGEEVSYGFFPAISGAWVVSNEDLFNVDFIENLKIRADWGKTGNSQIGWYSSRSLFSVSGSYNANTGMAPTQLANPRLTWEKAATAQAGIDLALFNGRITTSVTLYRETTKSLLLDKPLPTSSGWGSITKNIGELENQGIEFQLKTINVVAGDFMWNSTFNFSINQNKITK